MGELIDLIRPIVLQCGCKNSSWFIHVDKVDFDYITKIECESCGMIVGLGPVEIRQDRCKKPKN